MSSTRELKLTASTDLQIAPLINNTSQGGIFAAIFGFNFSKFTLEIMLTTPLHYFIFPFAAITEIVAATISGINLYNARNKNYSRVLQFVWDIIKAVSISAIVIGGIVAPVLFAPITPIVLTVVLSILALKEIGLAIWSFTMWASHKYGKNGDPKLVEIYGANLKGHLIGSVVLGLSATGIIALMLSPVGPLAGAIIASVASAASGLSAIYGVIQGVPFLKTRWDMMTNFLGNCVGKIFGRENEESFERVNDHNAEEQIIPKFNNDPEKIKARNELVEIINDKVLDLKEQVRKAKSSTSVWNMLIERPQHDKRKAKIAVLSKYKDALLDDANGLTNLKAKFDETDEANNTEDNKTFRSNFYKHAHQSFWSSDHNGGVEEISRRVETYYMKV